MFIEKIYDKPRTQYELFVNAFCKVDGWRYADKEKVATAALSRWDEMKLKKSEDFHRTVQEYIASAPKPKYKQTTLNFVRLPVSEPICQPIPVTPTPSSLPPIIDLLDAVDNPEKNELASPVFDVRRVEKYLAT